MKRFLTDLLVREPGTKADVGEADVIKPGAAVLGLTVHKPQVGVSKLRLRLTWQGEQLGLVEVETLTFEAAGGGKGREGLRQAAGPKWETDDGRVVQKIWQHTGCFDEGNTFLIDKMEITTGDACAGSDWHASQVFTGKSSWAETREFFGSMCGTRL